jgi:hypothetical protein
MLVACGPPDRQPTNGQATVLTTSGTEAENHGYGWHYDDIAVSGLRVRYADSDSVRISELDRLYAEVAGRLQQSCSAFAGPAGEVNECRFLPQPGGPLVIFVPGLRSAIAYDGYTWFESATILIDTAVTSAPSAAYGVRNYRDFLICHEMVHHLLHQTGLPEDDNTNHRSAYFTLCNDY